MAKKKRWSIVAWLLLILLPMILYLLSVAWSFSNIRMYTGSVTAFFSGMSLYVAQLTGVVCALSAIFRPWRLRNYKFAHVWATILAIMVALRLVCELMQINTNAGGLSLYVPLSVDVLMHAIVPVLLLTRRLGKTLRWILALVCTAYTAWLMLKGIPASVTAFSFDVPTLRFLANTLSLAYIRTAMVFFALAPSMKRDV